MYQILYRVYRDNNFFMGYSKHNKEGFSDWIKLKTTRTKPSKLSKDGYIISDDIELIMKLKEFLTRKQSTSKIRREYKVIKMKNEI